MQTRAILLDIEGTTTPISFVHDVLFPYSRLHLESFLSQHGDSSEVAFDLALLSEEHMVDVSEGREPQRLVAPYVYWLMDRDRKSPALKSLQGKIWQQGYEDGSLRSLVFADVRPAMERWRSKNLNVSIFSSGSELAQKLLFAHSDTGDLTKFISNYFDTGVGKKTNADSYRRIAAALSLTAHQIHFISDILNELNAAADAGMETSLCIRPGNPIQPSSSRHPIIHNFDELGESGLTSTQASDK
ncbi:MAG TPA: acireductone synthase [Pyrinomonadaceae bacterium]|jgi:2,3-diketo-5-methylthio-1-phosphopentane phosphatase|nr:acireductone synthase [Pyrinomonadaceae bacterium]